MDGIEDVRPFGRDRVLEIQRSKCEAERRVGSTERWTWLSIWKGTSKKMCTENNYEGIQIRGLIIDTHPKYTFSP